MAQLPVDAVVKHMVSWCRANGRPFPGVVGRVVDVREDTAAQVIELGQWIGCNGFMLAHYGANCHMFLQRSRLGPNGLTHDHYVACGCRWDALATTRTRFCKKHPRQAWESGEGER